MSPHRNSFMESLAGDCLTCSNGVESAYTTSNGTNGTNGFHHNGINKSPFLNPAGAEDVHDLICVGFGPASLAVAVAIHDALSSGSALFPVHRVPKVLFIEKQARFAWHAGMLLPGAKMQISFLKDLATLRNPRSEFTFLNYLHKGNRLVDFTNLGTFLPSRVEYEDYLRWCASFFEDVVRYTHQVSAVSPDGSKGVETFSVTCQDLQTGESRKFRARNVLLAIGGQPKLPKVLLLDHPRVIHSSQYAHLVPSILSKRDAPYRVAVVGAGQSAAEIFSNIRTLYPNSRTHLIMRSEFLRPSDDSPFVNSIFNPSYIDELHPKPTHYRQNLLTEARSTNYGVVRLELIEQLYEIMYDQKRELGPDETQWPHRIMGGRFVKSMQPNGPNPSDGLALVVSHVNGPLADEVLNVDVVIAATGYQRNAHVEMLRDASGLLPTAADEGMSGLDGWQVVSEEGSTKSLEVGRDYRVKFEDGAVQEGSGLSLQGCFEGNNGISDTLLSVLATRSDEIVRSIFKSESKIKQKGSP